MSNESKILVCVNNPESADNATTYACLMAKKFGYTVELLTVIDTSSSEYQGLFSIGKKISNDIRKDVELFLSNISDTIFKEHNLRSVINIKEGIASDEIEKIIENDKKIKLLILAASPNSSSNGKFIPYLTEKIIEELHLPILIIPTTLTKTQISDLL